MIRRFPLLLGLALAACGDQGGSASASTTPYASPRGSAEVRARIDPDFAGPVDEWFIAPGPEYLQSVRGALADLLRKADPRIRFRVLCHSDEEWNGLAAALGAEAPATLARVERFALARPMPGWIRNLFLPGTGLDGKPAFYLPNPDEYTQWADVQDLPQSRVLFEDARRLAGDRAIPTRLRIEGGMAVSDTTRVYLSPRVLMAGLSEADFGSPQALVEYTEGIFGRQARFLPEEVLPSARLDAFVALAEGNRAVVGDALLGAELIGELPEEERSALEIRIAALAGPEPPGPLRYLSRPGLVGRLAEESEQVGERLGRLAALFARDGYEVVRVPYVSLLPTRSENALAFTYTSAIQETRDGSPVVYLPEYGLSTLDGEARRVWAGLGYRVVTVDCLGPSLSSRSLRCLSQVTRVPLPALPPPRRSH